VNCLGGGAPLALDWLCNGHGPLRGGIWNSGLDSVNGRLWRGSGGDGLSLGGDLCLRVGCDQISHEPANLARGCGIQAFAKCHEIIAFGLLDPQDELGRFLLVLAIVFRLAHDLTPNDVYTKYMLFRPNQDAFDRLASSPWFQPCRLQLVIGQRQAELNSNTDRDYGKEPARKQHAVSSDRGDQAFMGDWHQRPGALFEQFILSEKDRTQTAAKVFIQLLQIGHPAVKRNNHGGSSIGECRGWHVLAFRQEGARRRDRQ